MCLRHSGFKAKSSALWLSRKTEWVCLSEVAFWTTPPEATRFPASQRRGLHSRSVCWALTPWFAVSSSTTGDHQLQTLQPVVDRRVPHLESGNIYMHVKHAPTTSTSSGSTRVIRFTVSLASGDFRTLWAGPRNVANFSSTFEINTMNVFPVSGHTYNQYVLQCTPIIISSTYIVRYVRSYVV